MSTGNGPWVWAVAPAKVNLTLAVLARRPDGFHDIHSWMLALDLCDRVGVRTNESGVVRVRIVGEAATPDIPADERNLAVRAALRVLDLAREQARLGAQADGAVGPARGLEIELDKSIPSQAGLGGGSSDAVACWLAASRALAIDVPDDVAERELARLGSDCIFFKKSRTGIGTASGRGDIVDCVDAPIPRWSIALVTPECGAPTAVVYARALPRDPSRPTLRPRFSEPATHACGSIDNDLEDAARAALPTLDAWRSLLDSVGCASWRLCGSGSSWFGLYDTADAAQAAVHAVEIAARGQNLGVRLARVVHAAGHGARLTAES